MRLLYLITSPLSAGFLRGQLAHLQKEGFEVVVGVGPGDATFDEGVIVERLPFQRKPSPLNDLRALVAAVRLIRSTRPDLVNASTPKAGLLGMAAAWVCRVRVRVYVVRGFRFETTTGWKRGVLRRLEAIAARCATHVVFNSPSLRSVGEREGVVRPGRGDVLGAGSGNGIALDRFADVPARAEARRALGIGEGDEVIGFVGRLTPDKGVADLVRAFAALAEQRPALRLLLVGDAEDGVAIAEHERVTHVSWLDQPGAAYRAMDVLAFPSYREGMPNVPLEAQLCGVPVVAYAATGTVDAVRDGVTGVLVPLGDVAALQQALTAVLDDADRAGAMGEAGAAWVAATFSQERVWSELASRYRAWLCD